LKSVSFFFEIFIFLFISSVIILKSNNRFTLLFIMYSFNLFCNNFFYLTNCVVKFNKMWVYYIKKSVLGKFYKLKIWIRLIIGFWGRNKMRHKGPNTFFIAIIICICLHSSESLSVKLTMDTSSSDTTVTSYNTNVGDCSCNVHQSTCDIFCCCDTMCSNVK